MRQQAIESKKFYPGFSLVTTHQRVEGKRTILRVRDVISKTGLSRSTIYSKIDAKSKSYDPHFPRQVKLGNRAVGWFESEVEEWLANRGVERGGCSVY
ncbi:AlpA family transcriptional regulator [Halomonas sp. ANAO-440]|uniref:helix-turn-helix transcriptional regulator n=1 Tax=Halomonas sp. ANAO-440 TaxID=2861360 RepID=UPI001CAA76F4|nr:AlpA family transcriptional regulator [Halomonas sp. ANAO-440]MBZ0331678.1 AlpA family transcriptional regulator [Halomonas sp. ANAO-440]